MNQLRLHLHLRLHPMTPCKRTKGYTLLEVVATILLMGIVGSVWGIGLINVGDGFLMVRDNARTVQESQAAMMRLVKELQVLSGVISATGDVAITYTRYTDPPGATPHEIRFDAANNQIRIDDDVLIDRVQDFSLTYYQDYDTPLPPPAAPFAVYFGAVALVGIEMEITGYDDIVSTYENMVFLRGLLGIYI